MVISPNMALQKYLEHFFKVPFSDPFHRPFGKEKRAPAKNLNQNKEKKQKATMQTTLQNIYHL